MIRTWREEGQAGQDWFAGKMASSLGGRPWSSLLGGHGLLRAALPIALALGSVLDLAEG